MFEDLLESLACEGQLVHLEHEPARPSRMGLVVDPMSDEVWKRLGIDAPLVPPGRGAQPPRRRAIGRRRHGHGVGQVAVYQAAIAEAVAGDDPATRRC